MVDSIECFFQSGGGPAGGKALCGVRWFSKLWFGKSGWVLFSGRVGRLELGRGGLFPGQNIANTNIYYYCHLNNKPFRYGYHNVILDPSPLTVRSRTGSRVFVVKSEALYYPRWGRGMLSTVTPPLMNKP